MNNTYCAAVLKMSDDLKTVHLPYHNNRYGFPITDDNELFCRLIMEINQAGLSWTTILKKEVAFRDAYHQFDIRKVAGYKKKDFDRLMNNSGIIRNRLKIQAAIDNAKSILQLRKEYGTFYDWLVSNHPASKEEWVKLFKKNFRFTGGEIVNEFLVSTGFLPGAHHKDCSVYSRVLKARPLWLNT